MMKKFFLMALCVILIVCAVPTGAFAAQRTVTVYNWGQYISDGSDDCIDVNAAFEEATGIKVNYVTYDSNETLYTKLATGGTSIDVIIPSDYMVGQMIDEGMLMKLNFDNIPNYEYIDEAYKNTAYDPNNEYSIPYTWGTDGVIYNSKYVDEEDTGSWDLLWNSKYEGKILMFDNPRDAFGVCEHLLGYSLNETNEDALRAVTYKLVEQKPLVQAYVMDQIYDKMIREEAWIAPYYAGDYLMMADENEDLEFYFPEEGYNLFIDAMCIPTCCEHLSEAEEYINFLCDPEICGQNLDYLGYSSPETEAKEYMDPDMVASEIAYPTDDILERGENYLYLDTDKTQLMSSLWLEVKTEGDIELTPIIGVGATAVLIVGWVIFTSLRKKKRIKNRCKKWKN